MEMVTTKKAQELLVERGISVSYPTLAQWTREGKFEGAERRETERGPVWYIPLASVKAFEPPPMGRPPKPKGENQEKPKKTSKKKGSKK
jgi:hypothetical protein